MKNLFYMLPVFVLTGSVAAIAQDKTNNAVNESAVSFMLSAMNELKTSQDDVKACLKQINASSKVDTCYISLTDAKKQYNEFLNSESNQKMIELVVKRIKAEIPKIRAQHKELLENEDELTYQNTARKATTTTIKELFQYAKAVEKKLDDSKPLERTKLLNVYKKTSVLSNSDLKLEDAKIALNVINGQFGANTVSVRTEGAEFRVGIGKPLQHTPDTLGVVQGRYGGKDARDPNNKNLVDMNVSLAELDLDDDALAWKIIKNNQLKINGVPIDGDQRWGHMLGAAGACKKDLLTYSGHLGPFVQYAKGVTVDPSEVFAGTWKEPKSNFTVVFTPKEKGGFDVTYSNAKVYYGDRDDFAFKLKEKPDANGVINYANGTVFFSVEPNGSLRVRDPEMKVDVLLNKTE